MEVALSRYLYDIKQNRIKATSFDRVESIFIYHIKDEALGRLQIGAIRPEDIQKLLSQKCKEGLSLSSIKKIYNLLGEFFRYTTATRELTHNPMDLVEMPHHENILHQPKEIEVLSLDEVKRIIIEAEQTYKSGISGYRYGEAIVLLVLTGMRAGEVRAINKKDIDFENSLLRVCNNVTYAKDRENGGIKNLIGSPKTKKSERYIPLNDRAMLAINRLMATTYNSETGYLLCSTKGKIVAHSHLARTYNGILEKAGIPHKGLHSTRHTFATIVLKDTQDKGQIKEVSELLGHSQVSTTYEYYIKTSNEDKRNIVNQLNAIAV